MGVSAVVALLVPYGMVLLENVRQCMVLWFCVMTQSCGVLYLIRSIPSSYSIKRTVQYTLLLSFTKRRRQPQSQIKILAAFPCVVCLLADCVAAVAVAAYPVMRRPGYGALAHGRVRDGRTDGDDDDGLYTLLPSIE